MTRIMSPVSVWLFPKMANSKTEADYRSPPQVTGNPLRTAVGENTCNTARTITAEIREVKTFYREPRYA